VPPLIRRPVPMDSTLLRTAMLFSVVAELRLPAQITFPDEFRSRRRIFGSHQRVTDKRSVPLQPIFRGRRPHGAQIWLSVNLRLLLGLNQRNSQPRHLLSKLTDAVPSDTSKWGQVAKSRQRVAFSDRRTCKLDKSYGDPSVAACETWVAPLVGPAVFLASGLGFWRFSNASPPAEGNLHAIISHRPC
jgi:hypothetical protein